MKIKIMQLADYLLNAGQNTKNNTVLFVQKNSFVAIGARFSMTLISPKGWSYAERIMMILKLKTIGNNFDTNR